MCKDTNLTKGVLTPSLVDISYDVGWIGFSLTPGTLVVRGVVQFMSNKFI